MALEPLIAQRIRAVRRFERYFCRRIEARHRSLPRNPFSSAEERVLIEIADGADGRGASQIEEALGIDASYLSRIVARFKRLGLVTSEGLALDGRMRVHRITPLGNIAFANVCGPDWLALRGELARLGERDQLRLTGAMALIEDILEDRTQPWVPLVLREPRAGDLGWVIERHGALYAREYRFNASFEAHVAGIVAGFARRSPHARERAWIAERGGERVGCAFLVERTRALAQLRLLLVEPTSRGAGTGGQLARQCVAFARQAGYRKITAWTASAFHQATAICRKAGFRVVEDHLHRSFGCHLRAQRWELRLAPDDA